MAVMVGLSPEMAEAAEVALVAMDLDGVSGVTAEATMAPGRKIGLLEAVSMEGVRPWYGGTHGGCAWLQGSMTALDEGGRGTSMVAAAALHVGIVWKEKKKKMGRKEMVWPWGVAEVVGCWGIGDIRRRRRLQRGRRRGCMWRRLVGDGDKCVHDEGRRYLVLGFD